MHAGPRVPSANPNRGPSAPITCVCTTHELSAVFMVYTIEEKTNNKISLHMKLYEIQILGSRDKM